MSSMPPLHLYRALIRHGKKLQDYNFRSYAIRRTKTGFQMNRTLQGDQAVAALTDGAQQLEILRRQASISVLYPSARSVME